MGSRRADDDSGLYTPKWISTTYTMLLLRDFGLEAENENARKACALLLDSGLKPDGGIDYGTWAKWTRRGETCVTGMVLSLLSYFRHSDSRLHLVAKHVLEQQMEDGGWNCRRYTGATHSSMNTTISVLEGLHHYEQNVCPAKQRPAIRSAQRRGREFLLEHKLFRSHRTGKIIKPEFLRLAYPPRWHYDILRALDYFQFVEAPRDLRLQDAIELLRAKQDLSGRWMLEYEYRGKTFFRLESVGRPSRWNTLRALRGNALVAIVEWRA